MKVLILDIHDWLLPEHGTSYGDGDGDGDGSGRGYGDGSGYGAGTD